MKIKKIDSWQIGDEKKLTPTSRASTEDFSVYLQNMVEKARDVNNAEIKGVHETTEIALKENAVCNNLPVEAVARIDSILEDLETFSELLNSSEFDPKKADNMISSVLKTSIGDDKIITGDPLRSIEEEVRAFSLIESIKWKRGDYL